MTVAIYPGSFDPVTWGHVDIVQRASRVFDQIIMAVVSQPSKPASLSAEVRQDLARKSLEHLNNVTVESFEGLTVDFARARGANIIIRGLRAVSDFEYEFKMFQMNKVLNADIDTVFMMAGLDYQFLSSSLVREVASLGGDVSQIVPPHVRACLLSQNTSTTGSNG